MSQQHIGTRCLHAGYTPGNGEPRNIPIVQSTIFRYATGEQMGVLFDLEESGYFCTHLQNPTNGHVTAKICTLEGGTAAMLTSSGQATSFYATFNTVSCGEHVIYSSSIYSGTYNLFAVTMKRVDVDSTFVDPSYTEAELKAAFRPETRVAFDETIANPALTMLGFEKLARVTHAHGVPLIVDSTFAALVNCRPFEWGAGIIIHFTTKYMNGHANAVGGTIMNSGRFNWTAHADKLFGLTTPDESYRGVTYTERFDLEEVYVTKVTAQFMRDFGILTTPMNAYLLNVGLGTLSLRMARHCENALAVARFLKGHPRTSWVRYPGLEGDPYYERARKCLPNDTCGVVSFGVKDGWEAASKFMASLGLASIVTHVTDAKTYVLHPVSAAHRQTSDAELAAVGVAPDLACFSVGIEDMNDILADLGKALGGA